MRGIGHNPTVDKKLPDLEEGVLDGNWLVSPTKPGMIFF
jgi:hypothetical protein